MASKEFDDAGEGRRGSCVPLGFVIVALCVAGGVVAYYFYSRDAAPPAAITATDGRLTLEKDDGGNMASIDRTARPDIWFRVTLENAPVGKTLTLDCDWTDPAGKVVHQNHYTTKEIDRPRWPTHAHYQFGRASPPGKWVVVLLHEGNVLKSLSFDVTDAPAAKNN
jgi:hypothetical protein